MCKCACVCACGCMCVRECMRVAWVLHLLHSPIGKLKIHIRLSINYHVIVMWSGDKSVGWL